MSISLRGNWAGDAFNLDRIQNEKPLDSGVVDRKILYSSLQLFLIAGYKYVLWNSHLFRHCRSLDREDGWCHQLPFFLDERRGVADINMQALCKIPFHGSVDPQLKTKSISTATIVPEGIPCNWAFVEWIVKGEAEIWELALICNHIQNFRSPIQKKTQTPIYCIAYSIMW